MKSILRVIKYMVNHLRNIDPYTARGSRIIMCLSAFAFAICLLIMSVLTSCEVHVHHDDHHGKKHKRSVKVSRYQIETPAGKGNDKSDDDFLFWYVISTNNSSSGNAGRSYYTYSSRVPVTNFSNVSWVRSVNLPKDVEKEREEHPEQEPEEMEVDVDELGAEMSQVVSENPEEFEGEDEPETGEEGEEAGESESEGESNADASESSSDSSDSGSSDSGGGDSGGGDGGGGE